MRTTQRPLGTGFGAETTAREVIGSMRLDGLVAMVTGGYVGVGLETTRALAEAGAVVVVPARSAGKARAALAGLERVELESLDLGSPGSIEACASRFVASGRPLHFLVNNAGIMAAPLTRDERGFESQLAVNHIGHYHLTARLWPALLRAKGARVVTLSSRGHARSGVDFDDPHFLRRPYDPWIAYGQSKSANALFAIALDARGESHGIRAFSVHPGAVAGTDLMRYMSAEEQQAVANAAPGLSAIKTLTQGAATSVWCATSPMLAGRGGVYCEDVDIAEAVAADAPGVGGVRPWATDPEQAERLWTLSEAWTAAGVAV